MRTDEFIRTIGRYGWFLSRLEVVIAVTVASAVAIVRQIHFKMEMMNIRSRLFATVFQMQLVSFVCAKCLPFALYYLYSLNMPRCAIGWVARWESPIFWDGRDWSRTTRPVAIITYSRNALLCMAQVGLGWIRHRWRRETKKVGQIERGLLSAWDNLGGPSYGRPL